MKKIFFIGVLFIAVLVLLSLVGSKKPSEEDSGKNPLCEMKQIGLKFCD